MKATVEYKGKQVTIDIPDSELEKLIARKPRTGYERAVFRGRYHTNSTFRENGVSHEYEERVAEDNATFAAANYYTDERLARDNARADTLMRQLRRYAAEHGGIPSVKERENTGIPKFSIAWQGDKREKLFVENWCREIMAGGVYFRSREACEAAIDEFRAELLWYFTEYDPQVRE